METEVKIENVNDSGDDSLSVQFVSMTGETKIKEEPKDDLSHDIKALPYKVLDDVALKASLVSVSFLSELTVTFEEKLDMKLIQMMTLLDAVCQNIKMFGAIENWDWNIIAKECNKSVKVHLTVPEVQKNTVLLLEWMVKKDSSLVKTWKSDAAHEEFIQGSKPAEEQEDFVVVKAEQDDFQNSSGDITEDVIEPPVKIKTETDSEEVVSKPADAMSSIPSDIQVMKAGEAPKERFFHNGEELDLEDVLDTYDDKPGASGKNKKKATEDDLDEEEEEVEEDEGEEEMGKDAEDEEDYVPSESDMEDEEEEEPEEDEEDEEGKEEGKQDVGKHSDEDPGSTSLNMLKQALMRKRGQSNAPIQQNMPDTEVSLQSSASTSATSKGTVPVPIAPKPSDANIGGTSLSIKDLSEVERTVLEATVASNIEVFRTTASTVEEREKKMAVWRSIAEKVNAAGGKFRTPEELVTIWSKKLFVDHVSSKKSLLVNKESDKTVNGTSTNTAFRSLISKSVPEGSDQQGKRVPQTTPTAALPPSAFSKVIPPAGQQIKGQFSEEEQHVFMDYLEKYKSVFQGSAADKSRAETLRGVWQEITDKVNEVNKGPPRTVDELQKKWTLELIRNNPGKTQTAMTRGRPIGVTPLQKATAAAASNPDLEIIYPAMSRPATSATVTSGAEVTTDVPIKIELDNAESDHTEILGVVPSGDSRSYATPVTSAVTNPNLLPGLSSSDNQASGTISFQLMDPVSMEVSTVSLPRACVKLQLVDKSVEGSGDALEIKEEPEDDTTFSSLQSKVVTEFISEKIQKITVAGPSIISLVMHQADWQNLVKLVNQADEGLIHSVANVKGKVTKTIKLMDNLLPLKIANAPGSTELDRVKTSKIGSKTILGKEEKFLQNQVLQHKAVLLDTKKNAETNKAKESVWKVITDLLNASYQTNYTWEKVRQTASSFLKTLSQKRTNSESPEPITPSKKVKVENEDVLVSPRWAKGDNVKAKNGEEWYEATIVDIDEDTCRAKVHFNGLTRRSDKWLTMTKEFLTHSSRCLVKLPRLPKEK